MKIANIIVITALLSVISTPAATLLVPSQYATIQEAIDDAQPGDTIQIASGVYSGGPFLIEGKTNITIKGAGRLSTIIRPTATTPRNVRGVDRSCGMVVGDSVGIRIESLQLDCRDIRTGQPHPVIGLYIKDSTGVVLHQSLLQNLLSDPTDMARDGLMRVVNDAAPFNPDNRATLEISFSEFYNTGRQGLTVFGFTDLHVHNSTFRKSREIPAPGYGIFIYSVVDALIENTTFSNFRFPFFEDDGAVAFSSAAVAIGNYYAWPGMTNWVANNGMPTQTVSIVNCDIFDSYLGVDVGNVWGYLPSFRSMGVLEVNISGTDIRDNLVSGLTVRDHTSEPAGFEDSMVRVHVENSRIFGNNAVGVRHYPEWDYRSKMPLTIANTEMFDNNGVDYFGGYASDNPRADSDFSVRIGNSRLQNKIQLIQHNSANSTYDYSGNYWNAANPDIVSKFLLSATDIPIITNLYTDFARTQLRNVRTVGDAGAAHANFAAAVAASSANDFIAVFNADAQVNSGITIASDLTAWTKAGLAIMAGGSLTINEGVTLTLDGLDIVGPAGGMVINDQTAAVLVNRTPRFGEDGESINLNGRVAWAAGNVEIFAVYGTTGDQGATNINDWPNLVNLGVGRITNVVNAITNLTPGIYTLRLAAVLTSDTSRVSWSPARTFELVTETSVQDFERSGNNLNVGVNVGTNQQVTIRSFAGNKDNAPSSSTTNSSGNVTLDNLLASDGLWFVEVERDVDGETNVSEFGVQRRTYQPDEWYLISLIFDFDDFTMGGDLGAALSSGLYDPGIFGTADSIYVPYGTNTIWNQFGWNGTQWVPVPPATLTNLVDPFSSYWLKTSEDGVAREAVYVARARTEAQATTIQPGWTTLSWPLPAARTEAQGWGFPRAHGALDWLVSDRMVILSPFTFLQLRPDGRWYSIGSSTPAAVTLNPGDTFIYFNSRSAFAWTP